MTILGARIGIASTIDPMEIPFRQIQRLGEQADVLPQDVVGGLPLVVPATRDIAEGCNLLSAHFLLLSRALDDVTDFLRHWIFPRPFPTSEGVETPTA